jgi:RNA polymerase subunit RPABC4/transcription elongation factor Spt4
LHLQPFLCITPALHDSITPGNLLTMIFIAGVSRKIKVLDQNPRRCPVCGLHQAYYKRMDHYLSLFFIPLFRVKKGEPFIMCDRCERNVNEFGPDITQQQQEGAKTCRYCGKALDKDFKYCPHCGKRV